MPADQETIRYTGFSAPTKRASRSCRARCSAAVPVALLRRWQRRHPHRSGSRNQPAEFTETRFPCWWRSSPCARIPAAPASAAAVSATRSITGRWSIAAPSSPPTGAARLLWAHGGKAGEPFCVTVDLDGAARELGGLVDGEPVLAGQICGGHHRRRRLGRSARARSGAGALRRGRRPGFRRARTRRLRRGTGGECRRPRGGRAGTAERRVTLRASARSSPMIDRARASRKCCAANFDRACVEWFSMI